MASPPVGGCSRPPHIWPGPIWTTVEGCSGHRTTRLGVRLWRFQVALLITTEWSVPCLRFVTVVADSSSMRDRHTRLQDTRRDPVDVWTWIIVPIKSTTPYWGANTMAALELHEGVPPPRRQARHGTVATIGSPRFLETRLSNMATVSQG
ncbi:hypothetical protein ZHAS_00021848 [Anopheles sinensis]|uniref:Uncharacterized protein n=1 Tax=Anopheles sinensis TaxID=74873 RepID=A0A084WTR5_ANOSI|nr:hypothetical protein ZHAS_00021848 [Anopheles sinensis]